MEKHGAKGWVNTNYRYFKGYKKIKKLLEGQEIIKLSIFTHSKNGLATNSIHFIDLFSWMTEDTKIKLDGKKRSVMDLLSYKNINFKKLEKIWPELKSLDFETKEQIEIESIYSCYLIRQRADIDDFKKEEGLTIPKTTNFKDVGSLSNEIIEKLTKTRPPTLGAASRISGVTPAAIIAIMRFLKKQKNNRAA